MARKERGGTAANKRGFSSERIDGCKNKKQKRKETENREGVEVDGWLERVSEERAGRVDSHKEKKV